MKHFQLVVAMALHLSCISGFAGETAISQEEAAARKQKLLQAKAGEIYDALIDPDFEGRDLFVLAVSREICPDAKDIFAWIADKTRGTEAEWIRIRGEKIGKKELAVTALLTRIDSSPEIVSRLEAALKDAKTTPKPDSKAFMESVERRIKEGGK